MKNKNGVDIEVTNEELEKYATCTSCKNLLLIRVNYIGSMVNFTVKIV